MPMTATFTNFAGALVHEVRGGTERFYSPDPLGSTSSLLDAGGNVTDAFSYWPYGEVRTRTGTTPTKFLFVGTLGYFADALTRLYVRARHYLASAARWLTADPLWPEESAYAYVDSSPVDWVDPSGFARKIGWPLEKLIKYLERGGFGPFHPDECQRLLAEIEQRKRALAKMKRRGWDKPGSDPGGKEYWAGGERKVGKPEGHYEKYWTWAQGIENLEKLLEQCRGGPRPPCPAPIPEPSPAPEPPLAEFAVGTALSVLLLLLLRGAGRGTGVPLGGGLPSRVVA